MPIFYMGSLKDLPKEDEVAVSKVMLEQEYVTMGTYNKETGVHVTQITGLVGNTLENMYFSTDLDSHKVQNIKENADVEITATAPGNNGFVTVKGQAKVIKEQDIINKMWRPEMLQSFPDGPESANLCLIHVVNTELRVVMA